MPYDAVRFLLFPHMTLSEGHFRTLSLLIPQLAMLRISREPAVPHWCRDRIMECALSLDDAQREQVRHSLKNFQEFAAVHGEYSQLASLSREMLLAESGESRLAIQTALREGDAAEPHAGEKLFLEAALFLEMALDLDEKEKDLETDLVQAEGLESEFREILGISSEDAPEEELEPLSPSLAADRAHLSFMLGRRIASWLRLYPKCHDLRSLPVLVSIIPDVQDDLIDRLLARRERAGKPMPLDAVPLGSLPNLARVPTELWKAAHAKIQDEGLLTELWSRLHELVLDPRDTARLKACQEETTVVAGLLRDLCQGPFLPAEDDIRLTLTRPQDVTYDELWRCVDKDGHAALSESYALQDFPFVFLGAY